MHCGSRPRVGLFEFHLLGRLPTTAAGAGAGDGDGDGARDGAESTVRLGSGSGRNVSSSWALVRSSAVRMLLLVYKSL